MEKNQSWACTIITQLTLCTILYIALNIGQPQHPIRDHETKDLYFISVGGGFRPFKQQTHLLKQIEKVVKAYKVGFVINISELGEDDPLLQNATRYFPSLKIPWYTNIASKRGKEINNFVKKIKITHGKTLAVLVLHTGSLQNSAGSNETTQLQWLSRTLEASNSNWHIAVGFHPPLNCVQKLQGVERKENLDALNYIFLKYGVNAYLSGELRVDNDVSQNGNTDTTIGGPYFTPITRNSFPHKMEPVKGFLLHRVSPLEIVTYEVNYEGDIMHKNTIHQRGRDVM